VEKLKGLLLFYGKNEEGHSYVEREGIINLKKHLFNIS